MRLMYLAMNFVSFSIPGMMSENRCCSGSMSFFVDIYLIIYIYFFFFVNVYVDIYIYLFGASFPLHSYMYIHTYIYIYVVWFATMIGLYSHVFIWFTSMRALVHSFLMQLLMLCFFSCSVLEISFLLKHVQTWICMHVSFMKTQKKHLQCR